MIKQFSKRLKYIDIALSINKNLIIHKRNKKISTSTANEYVVFKDFIDKNKHNLPLYFAHLRPTNPIRNIQTIKKVVKKFKKIKDKYSCLRMLNETPKPALWSCNLKKNRVYTTFNKDLTSISSGLKSWRPFCKLPYSLHKTQTILEKVFGNKCMDM